MIENYGLIISDGGSCKALTYDTSFSPVGFFVNAIVNVDNESRGSLCMTLRFPRVLSMTIDIYRTCQREEETGVRETAPFNASALLKTSLSGKYLTTGPIMGISLKKCLKTRLLSERANHISRDIYECSGEYPRDEYGK